MLSVNLQKHLGAFALDATWSSNRPVVALVGPSGSGKTLTLQCLAGLMMPDRGRIDVNGRVLYDSHTQVWLRPQQRRIGYVFQGYALFPHMTVAQNVTYGWRAQRSEATDRTSALMDRFGLTDLSARYPSEISGGQQQRVALARALATDPDLLLLDEPLSALDAPLRRHLAADLSRTLREWGKVAVLVTHDLSEAYQIADEVVMYDGGKTASAVSKHDLLWKPSSARIAELIGARNILQAHVTQATADSVVLDWRGCRLQAARSPSHHVALAPGDPIAFFVRPEYVRLIRKNRPITDALRQSNLLHGSVIGERDEGTTWVLLFRLEQPGRPSQGEYDLEVEVPRLVYERLDIAGDRHWHVSIQPGAIQLLPGERVTRPGS